VAKKNPKKKTKTKMKKKKKAEKESASTITKSKPTSPPGKASPNLSCKREKKTN